MAACRQNLQTLLRRHRCRLPEEEKEGLQINPEPVRSKLNQGGCRVEGGGTWRPGQKLAVSLALL